MLAAVGRALRRRAMPVHYGWSFRHQHGDLRARWGEPSAPTRPGRMDGRPVRSCHVSRSSEILREVWISWTVPVEFEQDPANPAWEKHCRNWATLGGLGATALVSRGYCLEPARLTVNACAFECGRPAPIRCAALRFAARPAA